MPEDTSKRFPDFSIQLCCKFYFGILRRSISGDSAFDLSPHSSQLSCTLKLSNSIVWLLTLFAFFLTPENPRKSSSSWNSLSALSTTSKTLHIIAVTKPSQPSRSSTSVREVERKKEVIRDWNKNVKEQEKEQSKKRIVSSRLHL